MITYKLFILLFLLYTLGAVSPFITRHNRWMALKLGCLFGAGGSLLGLWIGIIGLTSAGEITFNIANILPGVSIGIALDKLSAFFMITISLVALVTCLYSIKYMKIYSKENLAWWSFCLNLFILAMIFVVTVNNALTFLFFWEVMTISSYFLVTYSFQREFVRKAGFIYIVMTHIGTVFIATAFFLMLSPSGDWNFTSLAEIAGTLPPATKNLIFICALMGFGTKAGAVPLHIWLPRAHPAAPTPVSAIMSGVMLKTAIYGLIRLIIDILGIGPSWWGGLVVVVGLVSALIGVISALMEHDLKRLLAFHSVENIGIILMGIGTSLVFYSWNMSVPAAIALAVGLFHVLNHAIFKSLLFLSTASVYYATGTKDIDQLGGLIKKMPYTAVLFLIGAISISAIPPFNGFASEYQLYLSMLTVSYQDVSAIWSVGAIVTCAGLALTGALAAACFVKAFGISFLALPRTQRAAEAQEVPKSMIYTIAPLAFLCLLLGISSPQVMNILTDIPLQLAGGPQIPAIQTYNLNLFLALGIIVIVLVGLTKIMGGRPVRKTETWCCGIEINSAMEYTAASFSQPIRRVYRPLLRPHRSVKKEFYSLPFFKYKIIFEEEVRSGLKDFIYQPLRANIIYISKKWQIIQSGNINLYLVYIFLTLIALLIWAH
ncbi:MAG: NADH-ubiquinone oxidoreductase [Gracilibacter sp. BRH_c7a]|nr:MAG: NADH-ubiquinone oxidoreductase [Gracilibacter sp. BRH_c7a]